MGGAFSISYSTSSPQRVDFVAFSLYSYQLASPRLPKFNLFRPKNTAIIIFAYHLHQYHVGIATINSHVKHLRFPAIWHKKTVQ